MILDDVPSIRILQILSEETGPQQSVRAPRASEMQLDLAVGHPFHFIGASHRRENDVSDAAASSGINQGDESRGDIGNLRRAHQEQLVAAA